MFARALHTVIVCVLSSIAGNVTAQPPQSAPAAVQLTLADTVEMALARNPDLAASRYELTAARGRITQADLRPNPELDLELENFAGGGDLGGTDALETTLALSQVIELGDKRDLRRTVAEADRDLVLIEQRARELDLLAEVTRRFIDVAAAQERLRFAQDAATIARRTLDAIAIRVEAAAVPVAEQTRAQIALTRAEIEAEQAGSELRTARFSLAALWGDTEPSFENVNADLFRFPDIGSFEAFFGQLQQSPDFLAFMSATRLRDAELRLAEAQARPNIAVSLGLRRFEETDDLALVAGFSRPIAIRDRNEGAIYEARARRAQMDAVQIAAVVRARASLYALYEEMTAARARAERLRGEAVPLAEAALSQVQTGYDAGRFSFLDLATAQQDLLALQEAAIDAAADHHFLRGEIERLTSAPLSNTELEAPLP